MNRERVLLVDDDAEFVRVLSERLRARDLDVEAAASGPEALEKVGDASYDAVLLDLAMPGMDGIETLKLLLRQRPDLQVVLLTGHATVSKGVEAMKLGAADFLEKPAELRTLLEAIERAKATRMLVAEERMQDRLRDILERKSW